MKLFHGDNQAKSRKAFVEERERAKKKGLEAVVIVDRQINLTDVKQAVESGGLFGVDRVVFIEGLVGGRASGEKTAVVGYLKEERPENVLIWESKKVDGRKLRGWQDVKVEEFKVSKNVFRFLETIGPGKQSTFLPLWDQVLSDEPVELVFFLLLRQIRQLISLASDEDGFGGPGWLKNKLQQQASVFGLGGLLKLHEKLYRLEIENKTGSGVLPLSTRLELLLISI